MSDRNGGPGGASIRVRGARVHNLRDVDVDLPRDRLVVLTGVSGSGKSSLAFDTIYAEGQRRYIEGLSAYARQFLDQLEPPDVDLIEGLPPTVAIDQKSGAAGPRSTVATVTEIHDYLRLLYARAGVPHCPGCGEPIRSQTAEQMIGSVLGLGEGRKVIILAPIVRGRKGQHLDAFRAIRRAGLIRTRVDGETIELADEPPKLAKTKVHDIEAVVDRLVVREGIRSRLADSVDLALKLGDGALVLSIQQEGGSWLDRSLSTKLSCPRCGLGVPEIEPRTFSFNSPYGACPGCDGLGVVSAFDPELVAPDRSKSIAGGAVAAWAALPPKSRTEVQGDDRLIALLDRHKITSETPLSSWPAKALREFFEGGPTGKGKPPYNGVIVELRAVHDALPERRREALDAFRSDLPCPSCLGARLRPEARAVTLDGTPIHALTAMTADRARGVLGSLRFEPPLDRVGPPLVAEVAERLSFLERVGLGYLTLDRPADTLSGGELQRVRLATQIGSGLVGVCYVLDEPTAGLHPRDTERLLASLADLRARGNSVLVVEHDETTIRAADWLVDLGPGAGPDGGRVVALGPPGAMDETEPGASVTLRYLRGGERREGPLPALIPPGEARLARSPGRIAISGASEHNLKSIDVEIPIGALTGVSGVSGSGKSSLVLDILARAARRALEGTGPRPGAHTSISGLDQIDKQILIDQSPIGRTPRSTPATYTGVFDDIRRLYATTREAKVRGYGPGRFSFNTKGGRCESCEGQGVRRIEMTFLPDLDIPCETCRGLRFDRATLECRFRGKSIGDVLLMRVDEARPLFENVPKVARGLEALHEAGLGYVTLGQSSTTLSGGEAQRVKLAAELGRVATGRTLYVLDEPTTGLHFADVDNLLRILLRLADLGNTVVVIEHNPDVLRAADWLIDLGPDAGDAGGSLVAMGPPAEVAASGKGHTSRYL
ncbi:excinuclease ABC subunit UvrA [Tautonia plasticadhaerens]|uniref:UvrABC system protein A n=1 Tax=Tautonia plasticadhaerens TaxID=2527974 RepID=A0A518HBA7_9BACT|nr:excinuclease ABC subunit UvrA [Tautonia plasticadhaerens]QDV38129.1 UvrABC system protein A [Tautonia plasticadhaerens]